MVTRRQFLLGAGSGAVGVALSAGSAAVVREVDDARAAAATRADRQAREAGGASDVAVGTARLGVRQLVWNAPSTEPVAAITFDDGPTPAYTPRILEALAAAGVRATFHVMGHNAVAHPGLVRAILAAGHELGNHTWSHLDQTTLSAAQTREEIVRCKDAVEQLAQQPLIGFRPPRGELTGYALRVCGELGYDVFLWSCTRGPGGTSTVAAVTAALGSTVGPGDIVDLHDGLGRGTFAPTAAFARALADRREVEVRALPEALRRIADRGITLTTATDLLRRAATAT